MTKQRLWGTVTTRSMKFYCVHLKRFVKVRSEMTGKWRRVWKEDRHRIWTDNGLEQSHITPRKVVPMFLSHDIFTIKAQYYYSRFGLLRYGSVYW